MQIANDFWNQQTSSTSGRKNKSQPATDFANILGDLRDNFSHTYEVSKDAIVSGGLISTRNSGINASVYYSDKHSSDNPVYVVKGKNADGTRFETKINVNDVDPRNASFVEMLALQAHLNPSGQPNGFAGITNPFADKEKADAFTKADFIASMIQMMEWHEANKDWENYHRYKKSIDTLMNHVNSSVKNG